MQSWSYADGTELQSRVASGIISPVNFAFNRQGTQAATCGTALQNTTYNGTIMFSFIAANTGSCCAACSSVPGWVASRRSARDGGCRLSGIFLHWRKNT
jgi:hypothetical protein